MISTKVKVIISVVAVLTAYSAGRWASPTKVVTKIETVEVEKRVDKTQTDTNRDKRTKTVVQELRKPDGTLEKVTTITQDDQTDRKTNTVAVDQKAKTASEDKETTYSQSKVTLSVLGGLSFDGLTPVTVWGASISRPIWGPVTVGIWGLSDMSFGASIGLTF